MAADRSKLLEILQGGMPTGAGDLLGGQAQPVGTDAVPTAQLGAGGAAPPEIAAPPPEADGEEGGVQSILAAPDMTPEERMKLQAELALAARQRMAGMGL